MLLGRATEEEAGSAVIAEGDESGFLICDCVLGTTFNEAFVGEAVLGVTVAVEVFAVEPVVGATETAMFGVGGRARLGVDTEEGTAALGTDERGETTLIAGVGNDIDVFAGNGKIDGFIEDVGFGAGVIEVAFARGIVGLDA